MDPKPLSWVREAVGGGAYLHAGEGGSRPVCGVSIDSREVRPGDLFIALEGANRDGHEFVAAAFQCGAAAALISRDISGLGGYRDRPVIRVPDTRAALVSLARCYRKELAASIVAVTGSNGKTTVKDMTADLLEPLGSVVKAKRSFNNDIGLPLTILSMDGQTRFGVLEMGTNSPGEIAALCRIAAPDVGVVTNVGKAHLAGLGGILGVAEEKGALVEALPSRGMAFLNHEDFHCREMARRCACPSVKFAFDPTADLWGLKRTRKPGGVGFFLYGKMEMFIPVPGLHNAMNALPAIGVALHFGVDPFVIQERLKEFRLPHMRLNRTVCSGVTLINDAFNANPDSVGAAIEELRCEPATGRRILVLGDMHELGDYTGQLHRQVGRRAARAGISAVWAIGAQACHVERGLCSVDRWNGEFYGSPTTEAALRQAPFLPGEGDVVLVKGSRRMRLEQVHDQFVDALSGERIPAGFEA